MSQNEIERIADTEIQEYIFSHSHDDEKKLLLQNREILGVSALLIAQQIAARKKAAAKLSLYFKTTGIIYPPTLNWEQCSSEATGKFKAEIIGREIGKTKFKVADLTGGFGVDSFFLSKNVESLDYVEPDLDLLHIARHNHILLGCINTQYHQTCAV